MKFLCDCVWGTIVAPANPCDSVREAKVLNWCDWSQPRLNITFKSNSFPLYAHSVLVDSNDIRIDQDFPEFRANIFQVSRQEKWSCQNTPYRHLGSGLINRQAVVANEQHIWVVPVSRTCMWLDACLIFSKVFRDLFQGFIRILNVIPVSP